MFRKTRLEQPKISRKDAKAQRPRQNSQPSRKDQKEQDRCSTTPRLRAAGFEDEDEYEAPGEVIGCC